MDAVRLGSVFLGRVSYAEEAGLSRVGWVEAPIQEVREVQAGSNVGYGSACTVQEDTTLAVVGVGYYHGFAVERGYDVYRPQDCLRNMARYLKYMLTGRKLKVYIADTLCPVLGHVGMLNLVADVTGLECRPGDPVYIPVNPLDRKGMEIEYRPADQEESPRPASAPRPLRASGTRREIWKEIHMKKTMLSLLLAALLLLTGCGQLEALAARMAQERDAQLNALADLGRNQAFPK